MFQSVTLFFSYLKDLHHEQDLDEVLPVGADSAGQDPTLEQSGPGDSEDDSEDDSGDDSSSEEDDDSEGSSEEDDESPVTPPPLFEPCEPPHGGSPGFCCKTNCPDKFGF